MIDVFNITDYHRSKAELEELLLFCICVAGKTAVQISKALDEFLRKGYDKYRNCKTPLAILHRLIKENELMNAIKDSRLGQHNKLFKAFTYLCDHPINLKKCSIEQLEKVPGVGLKTSRFFLIHTRPNQKLACLDTHILKYLRSCGYEVPKSTPSTEKQYKEIEKKFLKKACASGMDLAEFDLSIWKRYAVKRRKTNRTK